MTKFMDRPGIKLPPGIVDDLTRRDFLIAGAASLLLGGCGGGEGSGGEESSANARNVEHKYGSTEVPDNPERVVTVGLVDHDAALALGAVPVGVTAGDYSAGQPFGVWPWARGELGDGRPEVLPDTEFNFERIDALRPDLIIGAYSGMTGNEYETLSEIAPTVAQSGEYVEYGTPWQEMTRTIGQALGKRERAEELVAGVEARFAEARERHPEFGGATAVYAGGLGPGEYYAETAQSSRVGVLTALGFEIPEEISGERFYVEISQERLDLLDRDVLLWEIGENSELASSIKDAPLYQRLGVYEEGRDVFVEDPVLAAALAFISVLSLPFVLDTLVPMLAAAIDGDPETQVPSAT